eukprot:scaffold7697_cov264-Chaetoceros_neogracile.AAC.9
MEVSYGKILSDAVKEQLPNSSHGNWWHSASKLDQSSCVIASKYSYIHENDHVCGDRSRLLVVLRWLSGMLHRIVDKYLSSPIILVIVPLLIGMALGMWIAVRYSASLNQEMKSKQVIKSNSISRVFYAIRCELEAMGIPISAQEDEDESDTTNSQDKEYAANEVCKQNICSIDDESERYRQTRNYLMSNINNLRESGVDISKVPKHIARYGRSRHGSVTRGHWDGSKTLVDFSKWCLAEGVQYCDELRVEAVKNGIRLQVLSTETEQIPDDVANGMQKMVEETKHCDRLILNICLSYGSRGEIINACQAVAEDVKNGVIGTKDINADVFKSKLLTGDCRDPDLVIRTSGEYRLSNFLLWQLAYSEMFFLNKTWPELTKSDLLLVIRKYATDRKRRFGK